MRKIMTFLALALTTAVMAMAEIPKRPVHTFSIVARDAATGDLGVAVQSHWFSVGTVVTWGEAGGHPRDDRAPRGGPSVVPARL